MAFWWRFGDVVGFAVNTDGFRCFCFVAPGGFLTTFGSDFDGFWYIALFLRLLAVFGFFSLRGEFW